jgi:hypothetical protein
MARVCPACTKAIASAEYAAHRLSCQKRVDKYECGSCTQSFATFGRLVLHARKCH